MTFRLAGSVPKPVLRFYHAKKKWLEEETKRIVRLKLGDDSPEMRAHESRLLDFQRGWFVNYVLNNPVKAGLVKDWRDWKWNYQRQSVSAQPAEDFH